MDVQLLCFKQSILFGRHILNFGTQRNTQNRSPYLLAGTSLSPLILFACVYKSKSYTVCILLKISFSGFSRNKINCAMKSYRLSELTPAEVNGLKARPRIDFSSIFGTVSCFFKFTVFKVFPFYWSNWSN